MSAASALLRATAPPLSSPRSLPPAPPPPPPPPSPPPSRSSPALQAVQLVAVVHLLCDPSRNSVSPSTNPPPLHFVHTHSPRIVDAAQCAAAKSTLLSAAPFIFPVDAAPKDVDARPATAPPPRLPHASAAPSQQHPHPTLHQQPQPQPQPHQQPSVTITSQLRAAKVLPLSASALFSALHSGSNSNNNNSNDVPAPPPAPSRAPAARIARHSRRPATRQTAATVTAPSATSLARRRANSLPRRPSASPPSRTRSAGIPPLSQPRVPPLDLGVAPVMAAVTANSSSSSSSRSLLPFLQAMRAHAFAVTAADGSRQYAFCRPLSALHALVVLADSSHAARFVCALEAAADRFAALLRLEPHSPPALQQGAECHHALQAAPPFRRAALLCTPVVAHHLCHSTIRALARPSLGAGEPVSVPVEEAHSLLASIRFSSLSDFAAHDMTSREDGHPTPVSNSAACLTPSTNSSGRITPAAPPASADTSADSKALRNESEASGRATTAAASLSAAVRARIGDMFPDFAAQDNSVQSPEELNYATAEDKLSHLAHLADAYVLFSNFSVRGIVVLITALLEERHVCIVGPSSSLVSRAVLAVKDLLRPFEWPHILSPILPSRHLHVLGAPIPYLVGILDDFYPQALELPLVEDLVFAHMQSGKVVSHPDTQDISKHIPRRLRSRLERRLTRIKSACTRNRLRLNLSENSLSTFKSAFSGNSEHYDDDGNSFVTPSPEPTTLLQEDYPSKFQTSTMWRSRSHNRLNKLATPNQSSLDTFISIEALTALDKAMSKFFVELLADLPSIDGTGMEQGALAEVTPAILPPVATSILSPTSMARKDSRTLLRSFVRTQMYMQWESDETHDPTFGIVQSENTRRRRKRAAEARERSLLHARGAVDEATDVEEERDGAQFVPSTGTRNPLLLPRFKKTRPVSEFLDDDAEDAGVMSGPETVSQRRPNPFANIRKLRRPRDEVGEDDVGPSQGNQFVFGRPRSVMPEVNEALFQDEDLGVMSGPEPRLLRKNRAANGVRRATKSRKRRNRERMHVSFTEEVVASVDGCQQELLTDVETVVGGTGEEDERALRHSAASTELGRNSDGELPVKRPWLFLRLPGSPWTSARESSSRDGDSRGPSCDKTRGDSSDENEAGDLQREQMKGDGVVEAKELDLAKGKQLEMKTGAEDEFGAGEEYNMAPGWNIVRQWQLRRYKNLARA